MAKLKQAQPQEVVHPSAARYDITNSMFLLRRLLGDKITDGLILGFGALTMPAMREEYKHTLVRAKRAGINTVITEPWNDITLSWEFDI